MAYCPTVATPGKGKAGDEHVSEDNAADDE